MIPTGRDMRRLYDCELGWGAAGLILLLSVGLLVASAAGFGGLVFRLHPTLGSVAIPQVGIALLLAFLLGLPAHEALHALAFLALGKRPQFGAAVRSFMPYIFVTCPGSRFSRNQYLVAGLAPLLALGLIGLALLVPASTAVFGLALLVVNTSAAAGDLWMAGLLVQSPRWVDVEDTRGGFTVWAPGRFATQAKTLAPPIGLNPRALAWFAGWLATSLVCLEVLLLVIALVTGGHPGTTIRIGPLLLAQSLPAGRRGLHIQVLPFAILAGGVGLALTVLAARVRARRSRNARWPLG